MKFLKTNSLATEIIANFEKQVITVDDTVTVMPGKTVYVMKKIGYAAYEVKTIYGKTDTGDSLIISLFDDDKHGNEIYQSLKQPIIQDLVAIPNHDSSGNAAVYFAVTNTGQAAFSASVHIKCVNL
jgi:hypothetical protein